jgi:hypothetical protein
MTKNGKIFTVGVVLIAVLSLGSWLFYEFKFKKPTDLFNPLVSKDSEQVKSDNTAQLLTWEDPAGFSFSYPGEVAIDPHKEDQENYSHLELTSSDHPGNIIIWMKDTKYKDIENWAQKEVGTDAQILDSELGEKPAKKVVFTDPEKLEVAAIDVDVLVLLEMTPEDKTYWLAVFNQITSSFKFIPLPGEEKSEAAPGAWQGSGGGGGVIDEGEEIVE